MADSTDSQVMPGAWRTLWILLALYVLSLLDRQLMSLLVTPIKADLGLTDTQIGAVLGLAFVVFYSIMGVVLGWAVDLFGRKWLLFGGVVVWSLATFACGLARSFEELFIARLMVGAGEGVLLPAAVSLIPSLFPRSKLSLANGIFYCGAPVGSLIAFWFGGVMTARLDTLGGFDAPIVGHLQPWQTIFCGAGLGGLGLALLAFFIRDVRVKAAPPDGVGAGQESLMAFARRRGVLWAAHAFGYGFLTMSIYAVISWTPAYLGRAYDAGPALVGLIMGLSFGVVASVGQVFWGGVIDRMFRRGVHDAPYLLYSVLQLVGLPVMFVAFFAPTLAVSAVAICLIWLIMFGTGPINAALQMFTPPHLLGRVSAISSLTTAVFAVGLTPFLVGVLTDHVFRDEAKVGLSIALCVTVFSLAGAGLLTLVRPHLRAAIQEDRPLV